MISKPSLAFATVLSILFLAGSFGKAASVDCDDELDMDCMKKRSDPKQVEMHTDPLPGLEFVSITENTVTVKWPTILGGIKYTLYYIDDRIVDDTPASIAKEIQGNPDSDGTSIEATIENLDESVAYNVYVRVQRDNSENDFLAIFKSITVPANRGAKPTKG